MKSEILQICQLCLEINPTDTKRELTGDKPTVFFHFSGHCGHVQVNVYPTGWSENSTDDYYYQTYDMCHWKKRENGKSEAATIEQVIEDLTRIKQEVLEMNNEICPDGRLTPPDDRPNVDRCIICGEGVQYGVEYFDFDGDTVCEECVHEYITRFHKIAGGD